MFLRATAAIQSVARRERPLTGRAQRDRLAADIVATPAARRSKESFDLNGQPSRRRHQLRPPRAPDGSDMFEVVRFRSPSAGAQEPAPAANRPGLRHIAFKVDDVRGVVRSVQEAGWDTIGEIVNFENTFLLCYVRGPEGLIVELAERLHRAPG